MRHAHNSGHAHIREHAALGAHLLHGVHAPRRRAPVPALQGSLPVQAHIRARTTPGTCNPRGKCTWALPQASVCTWACAALGACYHRHAALGMNCLGCTLPQACAHQGVLPQAHTHQARTLRVHATWLRGHWHVQS